ncbi:MAG: DUF721 domain-containing protein [Halofilum sp. (in: g-proteobacteria)]|nr:DUF721 domain-containing protein [Halofilum sp. (in: g-proteobacteria)]
MKPVRGALPPRIVQRIAALRELEEILRDCLPAECCAHCRVARLEAGTLHLVADSSPWRARLHFYSNRIIRHFNRLGKFPVTGIQVRVGRPAMPVGAPSGRPGPRPVPVPTARAFEQLASETDDPDLTRALRRLAGRRGTGGSDTD